MENLNKRAINGRESIDNSSTLYRKNIEKIL